MKKQSLLTKEERRQQLYEKNKPPKLSILEEVGNAITHGAGALFALIAMVMLLIKADTMNKCVAALIYGISMFLMMLMSCLYHSFKSESKVKHLWRRFDYTSIYLLIGGTFAPILLVYRGDALGISFFIIQWLLILFGIIMILIFGPGKWPALHFTLYFVIGWSGLVFLPGLWKDNQNLLWMILGGGIVYTIGMIPFAKHGKGSHFIWHLFVLGGAILHWLGIYLFLYL